MSQGDSPKSAQKMAAIATRKLQFLLLRWSPGDLERSLYEGQHHDQDPSDILNIQDWREKGPNDIAFGEEVDYKSTYMVWCMYRLYVI